jgi:hypothetical protein
MFTFVGFPHTEVSRETNRQTGEQRRQQDGDGSGATEAEW